MIEGWLTKRRDHMNIIWTDRYFILDGNQLRYYKKRGDPTPRGTYVLTKGCVVGNVFNSEQKHKHHGPVWMFRITFSVKEGEKSYKKDRFIDLGAQTEERANEWKRSLDSAISSVREIAEFREILDDKADIGAPPAAVKKFWENEEDSFSLFDLSADNTKAETSWWVAKVAQGLRVMEECPSGYPSAALKFAQQARKSNELLLSSVVSLIIAYVTMGCVIPNFFVCAAASLLAVGVCFFVFGIIGRRTYDIPSYKVSQIVQGSSRDVFRLIMNVDRYHSWDESAVSARVVQELDDHADIIHVVLRPILIWPIWQKARDMVVMRYWRREEDGSYFVMYHSTTHPECRPHSNYIRANMVGCGFIIAPQKSPQNGNIRSLVTQVVRYDARGYAGVLSQLGYGIDLALPLLRRVVGIRDELNAIAFIIPMVTTITTAENANNEATSPKGMTTSVDSSGLVLGVKKLQSTFPEKWWAEPDASKFQVRGPQYLADRKKYPAGPSEFHLVGVDFFAFEQNGDQYNVGSCRQSAVNQTEEFTMIINMVIPGPDNMALAFYYQPSRPNLLEENSAFSELLNDFLDGDDSFRNSRFKLIPTVVEGSFIIKQSVGSKPALIGNKLKCPYHRGRNYFEVDIDIASNSVANTVVAMVRGVTKSLTVDLAFLLEGQSEEELPEAVLGTIRLEHVSLDNPVKVKR